VQSGVRKAQGEPVAYGLLMPSGELDTELVGSKEDCEFWTRADGERQSGWQIVALYTSAPAIPEGWKPLHQYRACGCSDWFDGFPDESDGGGPYEKRTLYSSLSAAPKP